LLELCTRIDSPNLLALQEFWANFEYDVRDYDQRKACVHYQQMTLPTKFAKTFGGFGGKSLRVKRESTRPGPRAT
ncbi:hypothetical protein LINGRAHAP2_LOCUS3935, partial [Linum grandiflorum]